MSGVFSLDSSSFGRVWYGRVGVKVGVGVGVGVG